MRDYRSVVDDCAPLVDSAASTREHRFARLRIGRETSPALYAPHDTQPGANPRSAR